jgi:hypothetical protein
MLKHVYSIAEGAASAGRRGGIKLWQRSATKCAVDPVDDKASSIVTSGELKNFCEP